MLAPSPPALPEAFVASFSRPALAAQRRHLAAQARGRVLDLGGYAANQSYGPAVSNVVAVEPTGLEAMPAGHRPGPAGHQLGPAGVAGDAAHSVRVVASVDCLEQPDRPDRPDRLRRVNPPEQPDAPPFDSILGVLHLATLADADAALDRLRLLRRLIAPDGRLLLFEALRRPGWRSGALDAVVALGALRARARHRRGGLRTAHPVPDLARRAGFTPTSVERITMPTPLPPLRWCVRLVAVPSEGVDHPGPESPLRRP